MWFRYPCARCMDIHRKSYDVLPATGPSRFPPLASAPTPKEQEEGGWMLPGGTHLRGKGTPVIKRRPSSVFLSVCLFVVCFFFWMSSLYDQTEWERQFGWRLLSESKYSSQCEIDSVPFVPGELSNKQLIRCRCSFLRMKRRSKMQFDWLYRKDDGWLYFRWFAFCSNGMFNKERNSVRISFQRMGWHCTFIERFVHVNRTTGRHFAPVIIVMEHFFSRTYDRS